MLLKAFSALVFFCFLGAALVNFSEDCPKTILAPYLDGIMAKLEAILSAKFSLAEKGNKLGNLLMGINNCTVIWIVE